MSAVLVIELKKGVAVNVLITPRLFVYKGRQGVTLEADGENIPAVMSLYADVLYCGALNWWELSGKDADEFEYTRMDFHVWAAEHPDEFGRIVAKTVRLLSGKSLAELTDEAKKKNKDTDAKKKSLCGWITRILRRFWLGGAARVRKKRDGSACGSTSSCVRRRNRTRGGNGSEQGGRCS